MAYKLQFNHFPYAYYRGRNARDDSQPKAAPPALSFGMRHWWLAGWNDRDIELG